MSIGERIRNRRLELGLSVDDIAEKLGKNRATIYRYENDEIENVPTTILEPLAKVLDTSPAYIMGWEENEQEENDSEFLQLDNVYLSFAKEAQDEGIDPRDIKRAIKMIQEVRNENYD